MTENIQTIFEDNIKLLGDMNKAVYYFREQQFDKALILLANSIDQVKYVIESIVENREYFNLVDTKSMLEMTTGLLEAKKNRDFILIADLVELQLINFLTSVQELIISKEEIIFDEEKYKENIHLLIENGIGFEQKLIQTIDTAELLASGYRVEFSSCGLMTLAARNEESKFYFHTNCQVQLEAFILAKNWYQKDRKNYVIYGFGLGYHIAQLCQLAPEAQIEVYEADKNVLQLACAFTEVGELLTNPKIKLIYDPDLELLQKRILKIGTEEVLHVHYPSYKNIRAESEKDIIDAVYPWPKAIEAC
ncbi:MAG: hypothetical protein WBI07_03370 [Mobilitalea sp.]